MRRYLATALAALSLLLPAAALHAQSVPVAQAGGAPPSQPTATPTAAVSAGLLQAGLTQPVDQSGSGCQFVLGFKMLHDMDPADIGACVDNQFLGNASGDQWQHTTKGLLVWRKADNWTAFTNGYRTWVNGPMGLVNRLNTDHFPWEVTPGALLAGGQAPASAAALAASQNLAGASAQAAPPGTSGAGAQAPTPTATATPTPEGTPTPTATRTPSPTPTKLLYDWYFKRPSEPPVMCGPYDCIDSAPNASTQYISGHVMDKTGTPVQGIIVQARWNGHIWFATTDVNGRYSMLLTTNCPTENRTYDVFIVDDFQQLSSYVKKINYTSCGVAGEFHLDWIEAS